MYCLKGLWKRVEARVFGSTRNRRGNHRPGRRSSSAAGSNHDGWRALHDGIICGSLVRLLPPGFGGNRSAYRPIPSHCSNDDEPKTRRVVDVALRRHYADPRRRNDWASLFDDARLNTFRRCYDPARSSHALQRLQHGQEIAPLAGTYRYGSMRQFGDLRLHSSLSF